MNNKELILEKGLELFATEGYESIGVARIVKAADVTKPTLYHFYGNKEGLLRSIYEQYFVYLIDEMEACLPFENDVLQSITRMMKVYLEFAKKKPLFFWLMGHLRKGPLKSESHLIVKSFHDDEREVLNRFFEQISSHHTNLKGKEPLLILNFMSLTVGFIEISIINNQLELLTDDDVYQLAKQFLYGVFSL